MKDDTGSKDRATMDKSGRPDSTGTCPVCNHPLRLLDNGRCQECGSKMPGMDPRRKPPFLSTPEMHYQNAYVWLVFVSVLDIVLTKLVLFVWEGYEANPVAAAVIERYTKQCCGILAAATAAICCLA